jgi:amino acid permease
LGFGGGAVLITAAASSAYYTATLLSGLQGPEQKTYLDIANSCLEGGRHHRDWLIIVFQLLVMFPTSCVMILLGGEAMQTIDLMVEGAAVSYSECGGYKFDCSCEKLSKQVWTIIMGSIVLVLSMTKDMEGVWQISALGTISVFVIVGYCIVGSIIALANPEYTPGYDAMECLVPGDAYAAELLTAFGSIIFGYGFHAVVPDIQASLHSSGSTNTQKDMKKAITSAFSIALPAYLVIALLGFAAFGVNVASDMLLSMTFLVSQSAMYVVWAFVILKTGTEAVIYNQVRIDSIYCRNQKIPLPYRTNVELIHLIRFLIFSTSTGGIYALSGNVWDY